MDKLLGHQVTLTLGSIASTSAGTSGQSPAQPPRQVSGRLWAYDPTLGAIALETAATPLPLTLASAPASAAASLHASRFRSSASEPSVPASTGFVIVKVSEVKKVEFSAPTPSATGGGAASPGAGAGGGQQLDGLTRVHPVSLAAAQAREANAVTLSLAKAAKLGGKEVGEIGQLIFDALSKTLPCRWHGSHIIVLDEVVISGPQYDPSSTNVPNYTHDQLRSYLDGVHTGPVPEGAQGKANSWNRVTKVLEGERRKILASQGAAVVQ